MTKFFLLILTIFCFSCGQKSNLELAEKFKKIEIEGTVNELSRLLSKDAIAFTPNVPDTIKRQDILLNYEFNSSYNPWNKTISIKELNDSIIEVQSLETNELLSIFGIDTVGYLYRYTFSDFLISKIETEPIPNSGFDYIKVDSLYIVRLAELFKWAALFYPDELDKMGELDSESSKLILQMAKEKEDNRR